jgi:hypothetical protein
MQAILHIGDMKCGSKSIQGWLAANESRLRGHGFHAGAATKHSFYDSGLACYALDDADLASEPRREHAIHATADVPNYRRSLEERLAAEVAALPPDARVARAAVLGCVGDCHGRLGEAGEAEAAYRRAVARFIRERRPRSHPPPVCSSRTPRRRRIAPRP